MRHADRLRESRRLAVIFVLAQVFGAGEADRRLFIVLKHEGKLAVDTPFKQSWRIDTASVVERHAPVVFTCLRFGEGVFSA